MVAAQGKTLKSWLVQVASVAIGFCLSRMLGLLTMGVLFVFLWLGILLARWYAKREDANPAVPRCLAWANLVTWVIPVVGMLTGAATLTFSETDLVEGSEQWRTRALGGAALVFSLLNSLWGILSQPTGAV